MVAASYVCTFRFATGLCDTACLDPACDCCGFQATAVLSCAESSRPGVAAPSDG